MASRGRPAFSDPAALEAAIEEYFESLRVFVDEVTTERDGTQTTRTVELEQQPPTMAGLAHHLGVIRNTLMNYHKDERRPEFVALIARAKNRIAMYAEAKSYTREASNGARFLLEVNHGYGRDAPEDTGGAFTQNLIAPAGPSEVKAIPRWEDDEDEG